MRTSRRPSTRTLAASLLLLVTLVATGCARGDSDAATTTDPTLGADRLLVVATTTILGDVVAQLGADDVDVEVLMPPGADPHQFEPSARQAALVRGADLVVAVGIGLEEGLVGTLESAARDGVEVLELAPFLDPIEFGVAREDDHHDHDHDHDHDGDDAHDHGSEDPHFWQDPVRMADAVRIIGEALGGIDATIDWPARADEYAAALLSIHSEIDAMFDTIPVDRRKLVTNHDAFGYFAVRYGFEIVGTVVPGGDALAEPSPSQLGELVRAIEREGVRAIFAETTRPARLAEALSSEVGADVEVVTLFSDSLGGPGSRAETYIDMLRENARRITDVLTR